jgi:hypothetical protein
MDTEPVIDDKKQTGLNAEALRAQRRRGKI